MTQTTLPRLPAVAPLLARAFAGIRRQAPAEAVIPPLSVTVKGVKPDPKRLAAYREVCGFAPSDYLPITYPQVQAISLHLWMMTQPEFPFPLLGLVHLRNKNEQPAPLPADQAYDLRTSLGPGRRIPGALIFELRTELLNAAGEVVSTSVTTPLVRLNMDTPKSKLPEVKLPDMDVVEQFAVPANTGRRYASVSSDWNPIHMYPLTARIFGFNQAIAHGMWSIARCAAALETAIGKPASSLSVQYRAPLMLPAEVMLKRAQTGPKGTDFALLSADGGKIYLNGQFS